MSPFSTRQHSAMLVASIAAFGAVALVAGPALALPGGAPAPYVPVTHSVDFAAGAASTWTVPANITSAKVTLWGGNGGANRSKTNGIPDENGIPGGTGAALALDLPVLPGQVFSVSVGFAGNDASNVAAGSAGTQQAPGGAGGFTALRTNPAGNIFSHGGAGGSATLLFAGPSSADPSSLLAIAGGGGGAGGNIGGSSVSQGGMGGSSTLATANDGDPGPSGDEGCPPVAGGLGGQAPTMAGGTGQSVADPVTQVLGSGGGGGGGYLGGLGGASGTSATSGCSASGGGGGAGSSWLAAGTVAADTARPAGLFNGQATISWTDPTPVATLTATPGTVDAGGTVTLAAAVSLLPAVSSPMAIFSDGGTVLGQAPVAANGTATLPVAGLAPGVHTVTVSIVAENIAYAVSPAVNVTVNAAAVPSTPAATVAPSASSSPSASATATATATATAAAVPGLAQTGANGALLMVGAAVVLLVAGGVLVVVRRRSSRQR